MSRQDSVLDQMKSVYDLATKAGCYDAADVIRVWMQPGKSTALQSIQAERDTARAEAAALRAEVERQKMALDAINEIRNSIVRRQSISWSGHIYPLVAALRKAGIEGDGYDSTQARAKAEIEEIKATVFADVTAERDALRAEVEAMREVEHCARNTAWMWTDAYVDNMMRPLKDALDALDALRTRKGGG